MGEISASEAARILSSHQQKTERVCTQCGKEFVGLARAAYCSNTCAVRAYRQRNREELNARKREKRHQQKDEGEQAEG